MFEWLFGRKNDWEKVEKVKEDTRKGFDSVRTEINNLSQWIKHLNSKDEKQEFSISEMNERMSSIETDLEGIKNTMAFMEGSLSKRVFKQPQTAVYKQTAVQGVQEGVQTAVQTGGRAIFDSLSVMERALVYVLLNSEMKLSYEDLAAMLGKSRATIRGQINTIKQKSEGLVEEVIEPNGKKRVFIPDEIRENMLKNAKVRVNKGKKTRLNEL
ncbi:MAG: hypothetical protein NTZ83_01620 [Candidatus Pacearchaeota archaeon]|nr:hypothetical protein [Candidatus Pacearchaeota archaeon]